MKYYILRILFESNYYANEEYTVQCVYSIPDTATPEQQEVMRKKLLLGWRAPIDDNGSERANTWVDEWSVASEHVTWYYDCNDGEISEADFNVLKKYIGDVTASVSELLKTCCES